MTSKAFQRTTTPPASTTDLTSGLATKAANTVFGASGASHAAGLVADTPASAGTAKFLREDATWAVPSGGFTNLASYTTAGAQTWVCPANVTKAKITVVGGGGAGGSSGASGAGGGGGAGGCAIKFFSNLVPGTTYNLTVGAAAAASSFVGPSGVTPTGNGGGNGSTGTVAAAGAGGTAATGDLNFAGDGGQPGVQVTGGAAGGRGGGSFFGGGARGITIISGQAAGVAGGAPGAGGGGAAAISGTNQSGGAGVAGAVIIEY